MGTHNHSHSHGHCHCNGHGHCHGEGASWWKIGLSATILAGGMIAENLWQDAIGDCRLPIYGAAYILVAYSVLREAIESAMHGDLFGEFMLMSVASIGAFCIGEYPEAVAVMLLYCVGETLQEKAVSRARDNIRSLLAFRPDRAVVINGDKRVIEKPENVKTGDFIEVKPGERVALDGILVTTDTAFNTAALTGESMPRMIETGGEVLAGMIATDSVARLKVTRVAGESAVARILKMVEEASERKAPTELFISRFAHVYTPIVIALAALTVLLPWLWTLISPTYDYVFSEWLHRALVFLVISCPCALVISIPLGYFGGIGAASRRGILFKGGNSLDAVAELNAVVFDKTGTLTTGEFSVQKTDRMGENDLAVVAAIERTSNHPIAKAVVRYADGNAIGSEAVAVEQLKDIPGYGISAVVSGDSWLVGTLRLLRRERIAFPEGLESIPETIVACAKNGRFIGYILLADTMKDDSRHAVKALRDCGIRRITILSGDKQALVDKISDSLGVDSGYGDLLPEGKVEHIERLKSSGAKVAFVGDGINDAPVLALSDVGIAMGAMGADMAVETADVVIQTDRPSKVAEAIAIGRHTRTIVKQNIGFAIGVKMAVMILGLFGIANLWMAVFADTGMALLAVLNAMRVGKPSPAKWLFPNV